MKNAPFLRVICCINKDTANTQYLYILQLSAEVPSARSYNLQNLNNT